MIKCNLAVVMAKKKVKKQADLHSKTLIRKNTISDLYNDIAAGISFQDLDAICEALDCDITDLLERVPNPPQDKDSKDV